MLFLLLHSEEEGHVTKEMSDEMTWSRGEVRTAAAAGVVREREKASERPIQVVGDCLGKVKNHFAHEKKVTLRMMQ